MCDCAMCPSEWRNSTGNSPLSFTPSPPQSGYLDVVVPPDILNGPDGNDGATMSDEGSIPENGTVKLSCIATGVPKPTVQWRREGGRDIILRSEGGSSGRDNKHGENPALVNGVNKGGRRGRGG